MKTRVMRLIALCLTLMLLCTSLCGCDRIDELRASVATKTEENTLVWNGVTYKRMDALQSSKIDIGGQNYDQSVYINTDDVPALLMPLFCVEYHPTENGVFLCGVDYDVWSAGIKPIGSEEGYEATYFCREDRFDDIAAQLRDGLDLTGYQYTYYDYEESESHTYSFSADEIAAFEKVLTPAYLWGSAKYDYDYATQVSACTDDGLIDTTKMYNVLKDGGAYYIEYYPEVTDGDAWWVQEEAEYYRVPQELNGVFEKMLKKSIEEQSYWDKLDDTVMNIVEDVEVTEEA